MGVYCRVVVPDRSFGNAERADRHGVTANRASERERDNDERDGGHHDRAAIQRQLRARIGAVTEARNARAMRSARATIQIAERHFVAAHPHGVRHRGRREARVANDPEPVSTPSTAPPISTAINSPSPIGSSVLLSATQIGGQRDHDRRPNP